MLQQPASQARHIQAACIPLLAPATARPPPLLQQADWCCGKRIEWCGVHMCSARNSQRLLCLLEASRHPHARSAPADNCCAIIICPLVLATACSTIVPLPAHASTASGQPPPPACFLVRANMQPVEQHAGNVQDGHTSISASALYHTCGRNGSSSTVDVALVLPTSNGSRSESGGAAASSLVVMLQVEQERASWTHLLTTSHIMPPGVCAAGCFNVVDCQ